MSAAPERSVSYVLTRPVSAYMARDVLLLGEGTLTREAAHTLQRYERDDIIVTGREGKPVGIVTDQDILSKVGDITVYAEATTLHDIMSSPLHTIGEDATLREALSEMKSRGIRKLPVLSRKGDVVGIILQVTIANAIRDSVTRAPRLLSPPIKAILGNLGFVLQFAGVLILVPAIVSTVLREFETATGIYLTTVLLLVTGFFLNSYGEKASLNLRQASVLVFASLFILTLFGTIPYLYVEKFGDIPPVESFASSFFSSAAGFTTGGISLFETPETLPKSFIFYRSFTQLVGGMSFIYLVMTAFYPEGKLQSMRGFISGRTLHLRELFGTITVIFGLYIAIVASLLYAFGGRDIIDNFALAMSTISTGGFVPSSGAITGLAWQSEVVIMAAMVLGALPFTFHYAFVSKKFLSPKLGREVMAYFALLGGASLLFIATSGMGALESVFYTVSASTTAGLQYSSLDGTSAFSHAILTVLMLVGGCGFSTAGGIKVYRMMALRGIAEVARGRASSLSEDARKEAYSTIIVLALFPAVALLAGAYIAASTGADYDDAILESTGLITTGGLSSGIVGVDTDPATKVVMSFMMIFGRLEIIAIVYIFVPRLSS